MDPETRAYLDDMRRSIDARFDGIDQRFDGNDRRFDGIDQGFVTLEAELRRHFGVLIEDVRHDLRAIAEVVAANSEAITEIRARLDVR